MKIRFLIMLFLLSVCFVAVAEKAPDASPARFTVKVVDEDGKPMEGMEIMSGFYSDVQHPPKGLTDSNGLFVAECQKVYLRDSGFSVNHNRQDYYETRVRYNLGKVVNGRWEPWNPVVTAIVRRVINPIPMYAKKVDTKIPTTNSPCGYDLIIGDWVEPYGKGFKSDFTFVMTGYDKGMWDYESHLTLELRTCVDGIQRLPLDQSGSDFILCRNALENGYESIWTNVVGYTRNNGFYETQGGTFVDPAYGRWGYVFQIRSVTNEHGKIVEAYYGKVIGAIRFFNCTERVLQFTYYLNPTPNDRNLEFDPKKNLFKNLKSTEQVTAP